MRKKRCNELNNFYCSKDWEIARKIKVINAKGICERCGGVGVDVHHKIHLTKENVADPSISLNQDNLELLCVQCHNKVHNRWCSNSEVAFDEDGNTIKKVETPPGSDKNS